jgi:4-hydroxyproline epimerase
MIKVPYLDSHTGGEPTRLVEKGAPDLGNGTVADKREVFKQNFDSFRSMVLNEPRGSDVMVGALLVKPSLPDCDLGVIFFNNVGYLGMCGHGTIGLVASLAYQGRLKPGKVRIETPVGVVEAELHPAVNDSYANRVSVRNIPSYRHQKNIALTVEGKQIHGDVAWGGNWFFLVQDHGLAVEMNNLEALTDLSWKIREELTRLKVTGKNSAVVDHVELFAHTEAADSKSFVLCPGKAYDRSPCGTGTSAKLACLAADGKLTPGQTWRQQSVVGSIFEGKVELSKDEVVPTITGEAWVMAEGNLLIDDRDPFKDGIRM